MGFNLCLDVCRFVVGGTCLQPCPRSALKHIIKDTADQGYAVMAGIEPEFMVMKWQDGQPVKAFDNDPNSGQVYVRAVRLRLRRGIFN